jgi:bifunctional DNA-binding transcriptional regulator/antitoxin component of YhaV-PrlF toxin-antitoxin module
MTEINEEYIERLGIKPGDMVTLTYNEGDSHILVYRRVGERFLEAEDWGRLQGILKSDIKKIVKIKE